MAIYDHNNENESKWGKGQFGAMIRSPRSDKPVGYCDGTQADADSLIDMAEREGLGNARIDRKHLKTGREIWTVTGDMPELEEEMGEW